MSNIRTPDGKVSVSESLFYNPHNSMGLNPRNLRPLFDRVLVRDVPDRERIGRLWVPEIAQNRGIGKNGLLRYGVVVAIGPGDKTFERMVHKSKQASRLRVHPWRGRPVGWRTDLQVKPGDKVLVDRRREAEFTFAGERHGLVYEQQA